MTPAATAMVSGARQVVNNACAHDGELSAATDAMRATRRFTPKANPSSLPLNHFASAVVTATISDSAPRPRTKRPASITG